MALLRIVGSWEDPLTEQEPVPGQVLQDETGGGLRLELDYTGLDVYKPMAPVAGLSRPELATRSWDLLVGKTRGGRPVTLTGCALLETSGEMGGLPTRQVIAVERVIEGIALAASDEAAFVGAVVRIEGLSAWMHSALLTDNLGEGGSWPEMNVELAGGVTVTLRRHGGVEFVSTARHVGRLETTVVDLLVGFPEPVAAESVLVVVEQLAELVSVAALRVCRPLGVALLHVDGSEPVVHTAQSGLPRPERQPPLPGEYLLPASSVGGLVTEWMQAWEKKHVSPLRQAAYAAVEVLDRPDLSSGLQLNRAVSGAEALYRHVAHTLSLGPPHDQDDHDRVVAAAVAALGADDAAYLQRRLRGNDRSMRMQLDIVVDQVPADLLDYLSPAGTGWTKPATERRGSAAHGPLDDDQNPDATLAYLVAITVLTVVCSQLGAARSVDDLRQISLVHRARSLIWATAQHW